jgi:hypothetical protein
MHVGLMDILFSRVVSTEMAVVAHQNPMNCRLKYEDARTRPPKGSLIGTEEIGRRHYLALPFIL